MLRYNEIEVRRLVYVLSFYFCFARYSALSVLTVMLFKSSFGNEQVIPFFMAGVALLPKISRLLTHRIFSKKNSTIASHFAFSLGIGVAMAIWAIDGSFLTVFIVVLILEFCYLCASIKTKVLIADLSTKSLLQDFSKLAVVNNIATCFGPLLAAGALGIGRFDLFCLFIAGLSIAAALLSLKIRKVEMSKFRESSTGIKAESASLVLSTELKLILCASAIVCVFYSQINASLPMAIDKNFGSAYIGLVYAVNSICVIFFSVWINKEIEKRYSGFHAKVALGLGFFGLAFLILGVTSSFFVFMIAIVIFTFAEIATLPALSEAIASTVPNQHKNLAFTLSSIATSIGEGVGMFIGTSLVSYGQLETNQISTIFASLAILIAVAAKVLSRR
jgi:uncharacterized membrane protein YhfC